MTDTIINLFKYFAQFPLKDAVLKLFTREATEKLPGYDDLKQYVEDLPAGLIPDLTGFVMSTDEDDIKELVKGQKGYFMLLEYFQFNTTPPDNARNRKTKFSLAISILHDHNKSNTDIIDEALIMDQCLNYTIQLKDLILEDDSELCSWLRYMDSGITITPVEPRFAWQNIGWVLAFEKNIDELV